MKRTERIKFEKSKKRKKAILGSAIISVAILFNATISFADADIDGLMTSWYNKKAEIAKSAVEKALQSEIETQKVRIKEELKKKLDASATELNTYTDQEIETRKTAIIKHADEIISTIKISNEADKEEIKKKLDEIFNSATKAMDELKASYNPKEEPAPTEAGANNKESKAPQQETGVKPQ